MLVERRIVDVQSPRLVVDLPEGFAHHRVELIVLTLDEEPRQSRQPHPDIAGKVRILGDIISSAPESDWDLPR